MFTYTGITKNVVTNANIALYFQHIRRIVGRRYYKMSTPDEIVYGRIDILKLMLIVAIAMLTLVPSYSRYDIHSTMSQEISAHMELIRNKHLSDQQHEKQMLADKNNRLNDKYASFISNRYHVSKRAVHKVLNVVDEVSSKLMPKTLILAVIGIESGYNPYAKSGANAEGLMQMIVEYHTEKMAAIGGADHVIEARGSIVSGTEALKEMVGKCAGNIVCALQLYNGNPMDETHAYAKRVLYEKTLFDKLNG